MIQCEYCIRRFSETAHGLAEKTFHEVIHDYETTNRSGRQNQMSGEIL